MLLVAADAPAAAIPGRVAISADGNFADCDDIFASAVNVAILAKTGNAAKLVYYGYADHHWKTSSGCKDGSREDAMRRSTVDTAQKYGGFNMAAFINARAQRDAAIQKLTDAINVSTSTNRLWVIAAGPQDIIGRALAKAASSRRQYVTVISHSTWNDYHSDRPWSGESHSGWTWPEIGAMSSPPVRKHLPDQNRSLNTSHSTYYPWRDSSDSRLRWLWSRNMAAGNSWPDCSDAGMTYWLAMGRTSDTTVTPSELKALLGR